MTMIPHQVRIYLVWAILATLAAGGSLSGLEPSEIALLINQTNPDSRRIAESYCQKRGVPGDHIIAVTVADTDNLWRPYYRDRLAEPVRRWLRQDQRYKTIRCLVCCYGVPLRVGSVSLRPNDERRRDLIIELLDLYFGQLQRWKQDWQRPPGAAEPAESAESETAYQLPRGATQREFAARDLLAEAGRLVERDRARWEAAFPAELADTAQATSWRRRLETWWGRQGEYRYLAQRYARSTDPRQQQTLRNRLEWLEGQLRRLAEQIGQMDRESYFPAEQQRRCELILEAGGLQILCQILLADRNRIDDEQTAAALDSELSLVLWDSYPLRLWQDNELFVHARPRLFTEPRKKIDPNQPTLMVCRLDGPNAEIAAGLVDKALQAEKTVLDGRAYLDARGIHKDIDQYGSTGSYDESLRRTAAYLQQHTALPVVLDDQAGLFKPAACPDSLLYCGWYSVRQYIDSFRYLPGAVGYHIASYEAATLGRSQPDSQVWCKRMLEEGITATLGAVAEPYLHSMPLPERFFADLTARKYCLVECFYRTKPFNSWQCILIGDPLFRPIYRKAGQNPGPVSPGESGK